MAETVPVETAETRTAAAESIGPDPQPRTVAIKPGTAAYAMACYLQAWQKRDWAAMERLVQKSWMAGVPDGAGVLRKLHYYALRETGVVSMKMISDTVFEAELRLKCEIARGVVKFYDLTVRVVKESAPFVAAVDGEWGVVPSSFALI